MADHQQTSGDTALSLAYTAMDIYIDPYRKKAQSTAEVARDLMQEAGKIKEGKTGEAFSDGVHFLSKWGGGAVGALVGGGITAAGAALGGVLLGPVGAAIGGFLAAGIGAAVGYTVAGWVGNAIEAIGKGLAGILGIDFHTHGKTPGGGTWSRTDHPNGTYNYSEQTGGTIVNEWTDKNGGFHQTVHMPGTVPGTSYDSAFHDNRRGSSHFGATDTRGNHHTIDVNGGSIVFGTVNSNERDSSNGKTGNHTHTEGNGKSSDVWVYADGSSRESHGSTTRNADGTTTQSTHSEDKDKNGKTTGKDDTHTTTDDKGNTTTTHTHTDAAGHSKTTTDSHNKNGDKNDPPQPPPHKGDGGRDNPEGNGSEQAPFKPGSFGKGRPGHPMDEMVVPGSWKGAGDDRNEGPRVHMRDVLGALALVIHLDYQTGHGDAAEEDKAAEIRRKLKDVEVAQRASGEDFIHPKAKATLLGRMMEAVLG